MEQCRLSQFTYANVCTIKIIGLLRATTDKQVGYSIVVVVPNAVSAFLICLIALGKAAVEEKAWFPSKVDKSEDEE